jgi:Cu+-exporting ATPase
MGGERTLRNLASTTHVVMDKTGTLTEGRLSVAATFLEPGIDSSVCSGLLYLTEKEAAQAHPAGKAVFQWALSHLNDGQKRVWNTAQVTDRHTTAGKGVSCVVNTSEGRKYSAHVGSARFLLQADIQTPQQNQDYESSNSSLVYFAIDGQHAGHLLLQDTIRGEATAVIETLKSSGLTITMVSAQISIATKLQHAILTSYIAHWRYCGISIASFSYTWHPSSVGTLVTTRKASVDPRFTEARQYSCYGMWPKFITGSQC